MPRVDRPCRGRCRLWYLRLPHFEASSRRRRARQRSPPGTTSPFGRSIAADLLKAGTSARRSSDPARASGADHAPAPTASIACRRCALPRRGPATESVHELVRRAQARPNRIGDQRSDRRPRGVARRQFGDRSGVETRAGRGRAPVVGLSDRDAHQHWSSNAAAARSRSARPSRRSALGAMSAPAGPRRSAAAASPEQRAGRQKVVTARSGRPRSRAWSGRCGATVASSVRRLAGA